MKRVFLVFISLLIICCLVGCDNNIKNEKSEDLDEFIWSNNEAIYVVINDKYSDDIFRNIDISFEEYQYKKAYVVNKEIKDSLISKLKILFIIDDNINEFVMKLKEDQRIETYEICRDLPYESIDNRYFEYENNIIKVGDKMKMTLDGTCDIYKQQFVYDSFYVTPINYDADKVYDLSYFGEIKNISYIKNVRGKLLIVINISNYYDLIKTIDKLAKADYIEFIDFNYIDVIHPTWEISNRELIDVIINDNNSITITALNSGIVVIKYDGIECTITINN